MSMDRILVIKLSAIGDVIHALPVSHALKQHLPNAKVTWIVEPPAYDLLTDNPYIDEIIVFEKKKFKSLRGFIQNIGGLAARLKAPRFDVALDLQGLGKSAAIAYLSKAPLKLGTCDMREFSDKISRPVCGAHCDGHIVERYLDVARALGCSVTEPVFPVAISPRDGDIAERLMKQAGMNSANPYVVFAVGANWPNKRWPATHYAELADWLYEKKIIPVIVGQGVVDERIVGEIVSLAEIPPVDLVGKTTLKQLAYIVKQSSALVGGDTGTMHLAAALGKPAVALMGPTDAARNGPYGQSHNVIEIPSACKHCWQRQCRLERDCLASIGVAKVQDKLQQLLP